MSTGMGGGGATGPGGSLVLPAVAASAVTTPPSGEEYYFLDTENLDLSGQPTPSTKNSSGTVRVRDDIELVGGVLRPTNGENFEAGTSFATRSAQIAPPAQSISDLSMRGSDIRPMKWCGATAT